MQTEIWRVCVETRSRPPTTRYKCLDGKPATDPGQALRNALLPLIARRAAALGELPRDLYILPGP